MQSFIPIQCTILCVGVGCLEAVSRSGVMLGVCHPSPGSSYGRNLENVHGAGDSSSTFREGHRVIFNIRQLMPADRMPV